MNAKLATVAAMLLSTTVALACPVKTPASLSATVVASDVITSGRTMRIEQVRSRESVEAVFAEGTRLWSEAGYKVGRTKMPGWEVLSASSANCVATLQLTNRDGTNGYLARGKKSLAAPDTAAAHGVPLPRDARVMSSVQTNDDGRRGLVITLTSSSSMDEINRFFMEGMHNNKWASLRSHKVTNPKTKITSLFLTGQRAREQVDIVAWDDNGTHVLMTIVDSL